MKIRIKYIKKNTGWHYAVQVKKWLLWKTIDTYVTFECAERFIDTLSQIDNFNNKTKSLNKIVYDGWVVRNVYKNIGAASSLYFFKSYPSRSESDKSEIIWRDINNNSVPLMEIKAKKLFGKECIEPMKGRIAIEQMEE